ncbi:hypothetical protein G6O69_09465 [Pseudenhygromyxa sp. WMMC2535]|uniref:hypothetical protein n=1 Tax=Pseudenhygromyxa sp. WMMC2535 TaxID=2712867 RepID=UPI001556F22B|nr:hypothetical protein [Pseudenhygromyxa sp. WMMC2535]NVB38059.1 hypothetical protein [Pseudenhygromyxa sp. WMMC2535]
MMKKLPIVLAACLAFVGGLALTGCNAKGTCIMISQEGSGLATDSCWIDYYESACNEPAVDTKTEFFKEDSTAGVVRCQSEGFSSELSGTEMNTMLEKGESVIFYRPHEAK